MTTDPTSPEAVERLAKALNDHGCANGGCGTMKYCICATALDAAETMTALRAALTKAEIRAANAERMLEKAERDETKPDDVAEFLERAEIARNGLEDDGYYNQAVVLNEAGAIVNSLWRDNCRLHRRLETAHNAVKRIEQDEASARSRAEAAEARLIDAARAADAMRKTALTHFDGDEERVSVNREKFVALFAALGPAQIVADMGGEDGE